MELEMVSVDAVLDKHSVAAGELFICDMHAISFDYKCAQMKAVFGYTAKKDLIDRRTKIIYQHINGPVYIMLYLVLRFGMLIRMTVKK